MTKEKLRRRMEDLRARLNTAERRAASVRAQEALMASRQWACASSVALYMPIRGEMDTSLLLETAWKEGRKVCLPRVVDKRQRQMRFVWCDSMAQLHPGAWGILEPDGETALEADLMIAPGMAFDFQGWRLGYGGGCYDRYLSANPAFAALRAGLCFSFQIVDHVPHDSFDQRVAAICCEDGLIWT